MLSTAKIAQIDLEWRGTRDHFTHEIESPRPIYFKHFHWWERWRWSKFASHYTRGTNILCKMQDGCESLHLDYFQKPPLIGRPNTKLGDHGTPNAHNRWFILFYHDWGPAPTKTYWNSIWSRVWSPMTSHYTTTRFWRCVGTALGHLLLGFHKFMVTALGPCVKWPSLKT